MKQAYLIGVDLGTSATKAALYTTEGELVTQASAEVPIYYPKPGVVEQENDDFYATASQTVQRCIRESGVEPAAIAAIAFDSQMAGIGSIDEAYKPCHPLRFLAGHALPALHRADGPAGRATA